ncbi:MAG: tRNA lysidine(34) synthetase TilS [Bacteroidales bacterium]
MKEFFFNHLERLTGDPYKNKFLLAVSGGADSSVMAALFHSWHLSFDMAHCNFHLREEDSNKDMNLVQTMATKYQCKLFIKEFNTFQEQKNSGKSIEMVARDLRYTWFAEIGKEYDYLVTAHHANDNAETLLMNLIRGTGLKGLTGIPEKNGRIIRPLLHFSAAKIRQYALQNHINFREDLSNFSDQHHRNKIRLSVIPKLEEIKPEVIKTFTHDIELIKKQYLFYQNQIDSICQKLRTEKENTIYIDINELLSYQNVEVLLYEILTQYHFNADTVHNILYHLQDHSGKRFYSKTHLMIRDRNCLIISPLDQEIISPILIHSIEELVQHGFECEMLSYQASIQFDKNPNTLYVDTDKITFPLILRSWREGDYFYPLGMKGKKKLSDYFTDKKVDLFTKQKIKLLGQQNEIIWVVGYRADNRYKIDNQHTKKYYKIKYHGSVQ